jgi:hypothetical protein
MLKKRLPVTLKTLACLLPLGLVSIGMNANAAQPPAQSPMAQSGGCDETASGNIGQGRGGPGYGQGPWKAMGGQGPGMGRGGPGEGRGAGSRRRPPAPPAYGQGYPAYGPGYGQGYQGYGYGPGYSYPMPPAAPYGPAQPYGPRP